MNKPPVERFRKKPVEVEAVVFKGDWDDGLRAITKEHGRCWVGSGGCFRIETLEGIMTAEIGDYIIKGIKGELYPCKPDIFAATYEPVPTPQASQNL